MKRNKGSQSPLPLTGFTNQLAHQWEDQDSVSHQSENSDLDPHQSEKSDLNPRTNKALQTGSIKLNNNKTEILKA
jgi:hypothetical protein